MYDLGLVQRSAIVNEAGGAMSSERSVESRRSTRVPLKVVIREWVTHSLVCEGETIIVNLHGALISTPVALSKGMRIQIQVFLTDKRAQAEVVYVDPEQASALRNRSSEAREHLGIVSSTR